MLIRAIEGMVESLVPRSEPEERLKSIKPSGMWRFFAIAQKMRACVNLNVGEPDSRVPSQALRSSCRAVKEGKTRYTPTNGGPELRGVAVQKACRDYGLSYDPNCEILITVGGTHAIFITLMGLPNERDEVPTPEPGFVAYETCVLLAGGAVHVPLREDNDSRPSMADVTSLITDKSRVMILNHPNNPTGSVLSYDEVTELSKIAVERDLTVISDEIYEKSCTTERNRVQGSPRNRSPSSS